MIKTLIKQQQTDYSLLITLLILSFCLYLDGISWGLPSFSGWAVDEVLPSQVLRGMQAGFTDDWSEKYPPFHFYLLAILYTPVYWLHHREFSQLAEDLPTYTLLFYLGRLLSVVMGVGIVFCLYRLAREVTSRSAALWATLMTAILLPMVYYAKVVNLDVPYLFWVMISFIFYVRILKYHLLKDYVLFAILAAIAVSTKDQAYGFYILTPFFILWQYSRLLQVQTGQTSRLRVWLQVLRDPRFIYTGSAGIATFIILNNLIFNWQGFIQHIHLITAGSASVTPRYEENLWGHLQMFGQSWRHIRFAFGWPLYLICLVGLINALRKPRQNVLALMLWVPLISYYLTYITVIVFNDVRYLLSFNLILTIFGGQWLAQQFSPRDKATKQGDNYIFGQMQNHWRSPRSLAIALIFIYSFFYSYSINVLMKHDSRYTVESWMAANMDREAIILATGAKRYLPRLEEQYANVDIEMEPTIAYLHQQDFGYVITTSGYDIRRFAIGSPQYEFFSRLDRGDLGYEQVFAYQSRPWPDLLNHGELGERYLEKRTIHSNFDKINPEIRIYRQGINGDRRDRLPHQ
ncbi:ArnT family glycosyltransferase [Trichothermofontia sp.]